ncbi:ORF6N domain-containing protein [Buttiauxella sp. BIGb0552]|uniref:ORF6N domain-containing protein n=1 Tax=Buttiauxella sp. BIGb0552 TaxID=2485120 RepID=UPI001065CA2F|nr:ORF6N domain-containing protein [Buttiauxella sp. BIGb0552]TDX14659.1 ORF6N domain-containing protein [Buttiauxella sp. BIGb0552]
MQQSTSTVVNVANAMPIVDPDTFPVIEWKGLRVVTTETLAKGYATDAIRIQQNHIRNEDRFVEGVHFFNLKGIDLKEFKNRLSSSESVGKQARSLTLWTEKGAARMSKIVDTDEAWNFFERLEDSYFHPRTSSLPQTYEQALEDLLTKVKENRLIAEQRDHAVRTKAWIGEKREATAMATASAAVREKNKLAETVGACRKHATITAVENKTGNEYKWQGLRKWCRENDAVPLEVEDKRFGMVKSWPREAWLAVYGLDLRKIF